jgi:hypothetical protein
VTGTYQKSRFLSLFNWPLGKIAYTLGGIPNAILKSSCKDLLLKEQINYPSPIGDLALKILLKHLPILLLILFVGRSYSYAQTPQNSTPAFFGTVFSDSTPLALRENLQKLGAQKAGKIEIGDLLKGAPYFHFTVPRENLEATLTLFKNSGTLMLDGSQDPISGDSKEIRFVMWLAPLARLQKMGSNTLFIQRIVKNPDQVREEMRTYLKTKKYKFTGQQYLNVKVRNLVEYERIMFYIQGHGNMLIKQTKNWDGQSLRFSFTQLKSGKGLKKAQLYFTPARDTSKSDWQSFQESIWAQTITSKEMPAFYLQVIKYGDLSIYPGNKGEDLQRKISQSALRTIEAKVIGVPPPKDVYETMANTGDGLYLETSEENLAAYIRQPSIRGYYQGVLPITWGGEKVPVKSGYFEVQTLDPKEPSENILKIGEEAESRRLKFKVEQIPENDLEVSGSAIKNKAGATAVLTMAHYSHWFERPFNVSRASGFYQNLGIHGRYLQFTNFLDRESLLLAGGDLSYRFSHKIRENADGLSLGLLFETLKSGEFEASMAGLHLSYEAEFPVPIFVKQTKTMEVFARAHAWGPSLNITKSYLYGVRGKMQLFSGLYFHGGVQKLETSIENSAINRSFVANVVMADVGFGMRF